eukprot:jgi/Mesvir1/28073/Mv04666-RA.1
MHRSFAAAKLACRSTPSLFGIRHFSALPSNSQGTASVFTFGNGDLGRLGGGVSSTHGQHATRSQTTPYRVDITAQGVKQVACGGAHTVVLTRDGDVFTFGLNDRGQLGVKEFTGEFSSVPLHVGSIRGAVTQVAAGHRFTLCVTEAGELWGFGCNRYGQLGLGKRHGLSTSVPARVDALVDAGVQVSRVACGGEHALAVSPSGELFSWGLGTTGRLGHGRLPLFTLGAYRECAPRRVRSLEGVRVKAIAGGHAHSVAVDALGRVYTFGEGHYLQLGTGGQMGECVEPSRVPELAGVVHVAAGCHHNAAVTDKGELLMWGGNDTGCLGMGKSGGAGLPTPTLHKELKAHTIVRAACGWKHTAAVSAAGRLFMWGWGGSAGMHFQPGDAGGGQLGLGNDFDYPRPAEVTSLAGMAVLDVSCGLNHTAVLAVKNP